MIDILIPLGTGSRHNNLELRFCLRSIEKHLKGYGNIYIIGERPYWIKNIIHIPFEDSIDNKQRAWNIYRKILAGIEFRDFVEEVFLTGKKTTIRDIKLSDNFLYVNDDHYLLTDYEAGEFPYYHRGPINLESFLGNNAQYKQMKNTLEMVFNNRVLDFDIHCPIVFNKEFFRLTFANRTWPEHGYGIKSAYCKRRMKVKDCFALKIIETADLKFRERIMMKESIYQALEGRNWFSIGDRVLLEGSKMIEVLNELYPNKSNYEL